MILTRGYCVCKWYSIDVVVFSSMKAISFVKILTSSQQLKIVKKKNWNEYWKTHDQINKFQNKNIHQHGIYIWISNVFFLKIDYSIQINGINFQKQKSKSNIFLNIWKV